MVGASPPTIFYMLLEQHLKSSHKKNTNKKNYIRTLNYDRLHKTY